VILSLTGLASCKKEPAAPVTPPPQTSVQPSPTPATPPQPSTAQPAVDRSKWPTHDAEWGVQFLDKPISQAIEVLGPPMFTKEMVLSGKVRKEYHFPVWIESDGWKSPGLLLYAVDGVVTEGGGLRDGRVKIDDAD
jgi:hypothetical protein